MKKFVIALGLVSSFASVLSAATNSCGNAPDTTAPFTNPPGTRISLATANAYSGSDGPDNGCQVINSVFGNFSITDTLQDQDITTSEMFILGTFIQNAPVGVVERVAFTPQNADDWRNNDENTQTLTLNFNMFHPAGAQATVGVREVGFNLTGWTSGVDSVVLRMIICSGVVANCNGSGSPLFDSLSTYTATGNTNTFAGFNFAALQGGTLTVRIIATLIDGGTGGDGDIRLDNFYVDFQDTPEPSTFGMLGSALIGLGFFAHRRQRKS